MYIARSSSTGQHQRCPSPSRRPGSAAGSPTGNLQRHPAQSSRRSIFSVIAQRFRQLVAADLQRATSGRPSDRRRPTPASARRPDCSRRCALPRPPGGAWSAGRRWARIRSLPAVCIILVQATQRSCRIRPQDPGGAPGSGNRLPPMDMTPAMHRDALAAATLRDPRWADVQAHNAAADGRFVRCRHHRRVLPARLRRARTPRPENVRFFDASTRRKPQASAPASAAARKDCRTPRPTACWSKPPASASTAPNANHAGQYSSKSALD